MDRRLFVSTGNQVHVGWVSHQVASLQLLSRLKIHQTLSSAEGVHLLPLPCRLQNLIGLLFARTIRSLIPTPSTLRSFAVAPHARDARLHCTMIRHKESSSAGGGEVAPVESYGDLGTTYTLYVEHLGGFLPLLKGKKVSKLRPEFVIYDPTLSGN